MTNDVLGPLRRAEDSKSCFGAALSQNAFCCKDRLLGDPRHTLVAQVRTRSTGLKSGLVSAVSRLF